MQALKKVLKYTKIDSFLVRLLSYSLNRLMESDPHVYLKLKKANINEANKKLLSDLQNSGAGIRLNGEIRVTNPEGLQLGNNVHIGNNAYINTRGGVSIGDHTHISRNLTIYSSNHKFNNASALPYDSNFNDKPVVIEEGVWIGMNVNILPGVTIGRGAVIGMGTTVTKDVPAYSIVVGQSQRVVGERNQIEFEELSAKQAYGGVDGKRISRGEIDAFSKPLSNLQTPPFFVLSTGRAGSTTIAEVLSKHPQIDCQHEPKIQLIRISTQLLHNEINEQQALDELKLLFGVFTYTAYELYGESDQKLVNLVPLIRQIFPDSKFIWLIREPSAAVNSTWSRGWFDDRELAIDGYPKEHFELYRHFFSDYRPQAHLCGEMSKEEWVSMSSFARNCWYWTYWNNMIKEAFSSIPKENQLKVRLEDFDESLGKIQDFLGVEQKSLSAKIYNTAETRYSLKSNTDWDAKMKSDFENIIVSELY